MDLDVELQLDSWVYYREVQPTEYLQKSNLVFYDESLTPEHIACIKGLLYLRGMQPALISPKNKRFINYLMVRPCPKSSTKS